MKVRIKMVNGDVWEFENNILSPLEMYKGIVKSNFYIIEENMSVMINVRHIINVECKGWKNDN